MALENQRPHQRCLDAAAYEARGQLRQLAYRPKQGSIVLDETVLIEDDAPAIGRPKGATDETWFERLHQGLTIRKELVLDSGHAKEAWLLFCGREATDNQYPLHLQINGCTVVRPPTKLAHPAARHYYTTDWGGAHFDNWFVVPIPVGALCTGVNQILLWTESKETSWEIMVAAACEYARGTDSGRTHPTRSAKSQDGGQSWKTEQLGWQNALAGEYCIRLSLDRYQPAGIYRSPVIDLVDSDTPIKEWIELKTCCVEWALDLPKGCSAQISARLGPSPRPDADSWPSSLAPVADQTITWHDPPGRYLQFEVALSTTDPLATPALKGLRIKTQTRSLQPTHSLPHWVGGKNGRVVRSSADFVYEDFHRLQQLRQHFELDRVVEGANTEFEAQIRLMGWAYRVPIGRLDPYAWHYDDLPQAQRDASGALVELGPYSRRRREGHCLYCNLTLVAACLAMGYPARWVNVSTKHTYGHEVAEVWSNDFDKWVFLDATRDYYLYHPDSGIPMSLTEISQHLAAAMPAPATWDFPIQHWLPEGIQPHQIGVACPPDANPYPVFDPQVGSEDLVLIGHLQMPLRNDFSSRAQPVPWRLSSNWGSDQFYCWYSDTFPRKREYQHHTRRWQDFNPTLNQAELFFSQTTEAGVLQVEVDTQTPSFDSFLQQIDDGPWLEQATEVWTWRLHQGRNRLRVKSRNSAGVCGPESYAEVIWQGC